MPPVQPVALLKESEIELAKSMIAWLSPTLPSVTSPVTEDPALRDRLSEPEPVVIFAVINVPEAFRRSLPSRALVSVPREIV